MPALGAGMHVLDRVKEHVDGRNKPDHDVGRGKAGYDPAAYFFSESEVLLRGSSAGLT
jgi:hypothetical protein